jgi:hypothetical protein
MPVPENQNAFSAKNELMRIESFEKIDSKLEAPLMAFFRRIGLSHIYWEFLLPVFKEEDTLGVVAVKDRAWPPWGVGAHTIHALTVACPATPEAAGLSNVFVLEEDIGNIGLIAAVYKEMLAALVGRGVKEVSYVVLEGSVFAARALTRLGFKRTEELFLTRDSRYNFYCAEPQAHLEAMRLHQASAPDLLAGNLDDETFSTVAQWLGATSWGSVPFWSERGGLPEVIPNTAGYLRAAQPGGVPIRRELQ